MLYKDRPKWWRVLHETKYYIRRLLQDKIKIIKNIIKEAKLLIVTKEIDLLLGHLNTENGVTWGQVLQVTYYPRHVWDRKQIRIGILHNKYRLRDGTILCYCLDFDHNPLFVAHEKAIKIIGSEWSPPGSICHKRGNRNNII